MKNPYTLRQQLILDDEIPLEDIRRNELTVLAHKAAANNDWPAYYWVEDLLDAKLHPCDCVPKYDLEEAKAILQKLTPWPIEWNSKSAGHICAAAND